MTATLVLFAFHFPWQRVYVWFVLPMPVWLLVVIYVALDGLGAAWESDAAGSVTSATWAVRSSGRSTTRPESDSASCSLDGRAQGGASGRSFA